eukprot:1108663-Amorphochlora_amoeboformis.AAC.2
MLNPGIPREFEGVPPRKDPVDDRLRDFTNFRGHLSSMSESKSIFSPPGDRLKYNHVHFYAEKLENLAHYKALERRANEFEAAYMK